MQKTLKTKPQRLVRKQILISAAQNRQLKGRAVQMGVPEAEIVRRGIDLALAEGDGAEPDWKAAWRQAAGMWKGRTDLDAFYAENRERRRLRRERINRRMASDEPQ